jgi:hypothetical protein
MSSRARELSRSRELSPARAGDPARDNPTLDTDMRSNVDLLAVVYRLDFLYAVPSDNVPRPGFNQTSKKIEVLTIQLVSYREVSLLAGLIQVRGPLITSFVLVLIRLARRSRSR